MKTCLYLLAVWLVLAPAALAADELPIVFARAGHKATLPWGGDGGKAAGPMALWALGQRWGQPLAVNQGAVQFLAPDVRVPVVLRLTPANDARAVVGEVVVVPDRPLVWDADIQLAAVGAPAWFDNWSEAVGLPVRKFAKLASLEAEHWPAAERPSLLILGRATAQDRPAAVCRLAMKRKTNALALEADWFGPSDAGGGTAAVAPPQIRGDLAAIGGQSWPQPLEFAGPRQPWPGLLNRWAWIVDARGLPLVERLADASPPTTAVRSVVVSYLPWQRQLGRRDVADATFLALLSAAARTALPQRWRQIVFVYPKPDAVSPQKRPILAAAAAATVLTDESDAALLYVLDLRGPAPPPRAAIREAKSLEDRIGRAEDHPGAQGGTLLILGDDELLDSWKWLKLDRAKQIIRRSGVVWLSDNDLPPSTKNRIRLMSTLTELGAPLAEPGPKEKEP
ncbi:MAG: hypothetical protein ACLQLG_10715 [Thermoguttaceae bacterium]